MVGDMDVVEEYVADLIDGFKVKQNALLAESFRKREFPPVMKNVILGDAKADAGKERLHRKGNVDGIRIGSNDVRFGDTELPFAV